MILPPVVALEIGTSKVVAITAEQHEDGHILITGLGEHPSLGVRKGVIVDVENALGCVRHALITAEESGKVAIHQVFLALSGGMQMLQNRGTWPILSPSEGVTREDMEQVTEVSKRVTLPNDREIMHSIPQFYYVDGERVDSPLKFEGTKLTLDTLLLHAKGPVVRNITHLVKSISVEVSSVVFSGLSASLAVLTPEQKESGAVVIDLGGGTTNYLAYADSAVAAGAALSVGGDHVTNDVAMAFKIPRNQAELLKREAGCLPPDEALRGHRINLPPEVGFPARSVSAEALHTVIHLRMNETLRMIRDVMEKHELLRCMGAGVILTGGGARMKGIRELAEEVFGLPCAIGTSVNASGLATVTENPQYSTVVGLACYAFRNAARDTKTSMLERFIGKVEKFIS